MKGLYAVLIGQLRCLSKYVAVAVAFCTTISWAQAEPTNGSSALGELNHSIKGPRGQPSAAELSAACHSVLQSVNTESLGKYVVPMHELNDINIHLSSGWWPNGKPFGAKIDLFANGVPVYVAAASSEGTMAGFHYEIFSDTGEPIATHESSEDDWEGGDGLEPELIEVAGRSYILGAYGRDADHLSWFDGDRTEHKACSFKFTGQSVERLSKSSNASVCNAMSRRPLHYLPFDKPKLFTDEDLQIAGYSETRIIDGEMLADINNDGTLRRVINLYLLSGRARGCSQSYLAVIDSSNAHIDSVLSRPLRDIGGCNDTDDRPFIFRGQIYIETKSGEEIADGIHKISQLKNGKVSTICEFKSAPQYQLQSTSNGAGP